MLKRFFTLFGIIGLTFGCIEGCFSKAWALKVQEIKTPQGISVWLAPHDGPVLSIQIAFKGAGERTDPQGKAGRASVYAGLVTEGAGNFDSQALAARLEDLCSSVHLTPTDDHMICSILTLHKNKDETLQLARDILFSPRLSSESLEGVKKRSAAHIASLEGNPEYLLQKACAQVVLGDHPYGRFATNHTLSSLTVDDMKDYRKFWGLDQLVVIISGNLNSQEAVTTVHRLFEGLPAQAQVQDIPSVEVPSIGTVQILEANIPQSTVCFFQPGLRPQDPDYIAVGVLNEVLGGGAILTSRLAQEVRVKKGYAYGIGTNLVVLDHHTRWGGRTSTQNETAFSAMRLIQEEWKRAAREGITAQELRAIKKYLIGSWALNFKTSQEIVGTLMSVRLEGWDVDFVNRRHQKIQDVTLQDVKRVAGKYLKPEQLGFVIVGRPTPDPSMPTQTLTLNKPI